MGAISQEKLKVSNYNGNGITICKHVYNNRSETIINGIQWYIGVESGNVKCFDTSCSLYVWILLKSSYELSTLQ